MPSSNIASTDFELTPQTTLIRGLWLDLGSRVEKDSNWLRIEWLLENRLELLVPAHGNACSALYCSPENGQLWHYYRVAPEMHEGGPPALEQIDEERAKELFGDFTPDSNLATTNKTD